MLNMPFVIVVESERRKDRDETKIFCGGGIGTTFDKRICISAQDSTSYARTRTVATSPFRVSTFDNYLRTWQKRRD